MILQSVQSLVQMIAHEAGHAVVSWASPCISGLEHVRFSPAAGEAECVAFGQEPDSPSECLEACAVFLAGAAGESLKFGGFGRLGRTDLEMAVRLARRARRIMGRPRRRPRPTYFLRKLPEGVHPELRGFLDAAYDLAVARLEANRAAHERLYALLRGGYPAGKLEYRAAELEACLGPRPCRSTKR